EVDARVAARVHRAEGALPQALHLGHRGGVEGGGDDEAGAALRRVLRVVVVELPVRDDLAGEGRLGLVVAEHGDLDLARVDGGLHHRLAIEIEVSVLDNEDRKSTRLNSSHDQISYA